VEEVRSQKSEVRIVNPPNCFCGLLFKHDGKHRPQDVELHQCVVRRKGILLGGEWYFDPDLKRYFGLKVEVRVTKGNRNVIWVAMPTRLIPVGRCLEPDCDLCVEASRWVAQMAARSSSDDNPAASFRDDDK
jgi:hypothetical protein